MKRFHLLVLILTIAGLPLNLQAQDCSPLIPKKILTSYFTIHSAKIATDNRTGLMWSRCQYGDEIGSYGCTSNDVQKSYTWGEALAIAEDLTFAGYSDWRVPNFKEMATIIETACDNPALNNTVFPSTAIYLWTSTPSRTDTAFNFALYFDGAIMDTEKTLERGFFVVRDAR